MDKTKIDWADASWNPVTGCLHGCAYCYARRIAERFRGCCLDLVGDTYQIDTAYTRMICVIKLAQAGVLSKQLICMVTERMECAACKLAMRSGLI